MALVKYDERERVETKRRAYRRDPARESAPAYSQQRTTLPFHRANILPSVVFMYATGAQTPFYRKTRVMPWMHAACRRVCAFFIRRAYI